MATFIPPTDNFVPSIAVDTDGIGLLLFRYFAPTARGRNVYKLVDATFTENEPADFATIDTTYHGGHSITITTSEATALTAAGYGAYIT